MMIKEKVIFWPLLAVFIGILAFGFVSQGKMEEATKGLLQDIETATKKTKAKKKVEKKAWSLEAIKMVATLDGYKLLLERSPFFRVVDKTEGVKKEVVVSVKQEEPKKAVLKYKGRAMMGQKVVVVIEDQGTGKSFFVQEGDMVGDFLVLRIDEKEVALRKKGGEEIILSAVKEKKEAKKEEKEEEEEKIEKESKEEGEDAV